MLSRISVMIVAFSALCAFNASAATDVQDVLAVNHPYQATAISAAHNCYELTKTTAIVCNASFGQLGARTLVQRVACEIQAPVGSEVNAAYLSGSGLMSGGSINPAILPLSFFAYAPNAFTGNARFAIDTAEYAWFNGGDAPYVQVYVVGANATESNVTFGNCVLTGYYY